MRCGMADGARRTCRSRASEAKMSQPTSSTVNTPIRAIAGYWLDGAMRTLDGFKKGAHATVNDPPPVTPYQVVFETGKVRLRHYAAPAKSHRTPIVLVYALIKRPFVLDIQKGRSVIEHLTRA